LERLARLDAMEFELTARGQRLRGELERAFGTPPITLLAGGATIGEIERVFGDRAQARAAVDAMLMCDAVVAAVAHIGLGTPVEAPVERPVVARAPTRPPAPGSALFDLLFDDLGFEDMQPDGGAVPIELDGGVSEES